jgi:hypothetical protein
VQAGGELRGVAELGQLGEHHSRHEALGQPEGFQRVGRGGLAELRASVLREAHAEEQVGIFWYFLRVRMGRAKDWEWTGGTYERMHLYTPVSPSAQSFHDTSALSHSP